MQSRTLVIIVAIVAAILVAGLFYVLMRKSHRAPGGEPTLQGAIRSGSAEFAKDQPNIVLDTPEADEAKRPLGDIVMSLHTTVRNLTGRTLNGLEMWAAVVDRQGKPVKERTVVIIPERQAELPPNKTLPVSILLEGMKDTDERSNIKMTVTGFRFKD